MIVKKYIARYNNEVLSDPLGFMKKINSIFDNYSDTSDRARELNGCISVYNDCWELIHLSGVKISSWREKMILRTIYPALGIMRMSLMMSGCRGEDIFKVKTPATVEIKLPKRYV